MANNKSSDIAIHKQLSDIKRDIMEARIVRARLDERIKVLEDFKIHLKKHFVTVEEFAPRKKILDGMVALVLVTVFTAILALVIFRIQ